MALRKAFAVALFVLSAAWVAVTLIVSPMAAMAAGVLYTAIVITAGVIRENHDGRDR